MNKYIVVAGNIGVGKSTLVNLLCQQLGWDPFYEPVTENPYLADFYNDMNTWGFHSQVFFLAHRLQIQHAILKHPGSVIQDRSIYEDAEIFAHNLHRQGHLSQRDYSTYLALYQAMTDFLPPPDLVIYLQASVHTLQQRISQRSRDYEQSISADYLSQLNDLYQEWINHFTLCPVLTIPADDLDYVAHSRHLDLIVQKVQEKLTGKEIVNFNPEELAQAGH
ncbi:MAG: deoxynucleoside kinase [Anaerolineaceae bacterium]|nr:deoxynucleoside kinase [Anaerolineaceae bacterium]